MDFFFFDYVYKETINKYIKKCSSQRVRRVAKIQLLLKRMVKRLRNTDPKQ